MSFKINNTIGLTELTQACSQCRGSLMNTKKKEIEAYWINYIYIEGNKIEVNQYWCKKCYKAVW